MTEHTRPTDANTLSTIPPCKASCCAHVQPNGARSSGHRKADNPVCIAAVRLLLLTGRRPGEIRCLPVLLRGQPGPAYAD